VVANMRTGEFLEGDKAKKIKYTFHRPILRNNKNPVKRPGTAGRTPRSTPDQPDGLLANFRAPCWP
jgi:hypothetical protein